MLEVLSSGLYTTIQDLGRYGYRKFGVPVSGAMDSESAGLANQLVGNTLDCAVLEITMLPPKLLFKAPTLIAIVGAKVSPSVNGNSIAINQPVAISKNSELHFGTLSKGTRVYLAAYGGFTTDKKLGSRSFYKPITSKDRLLKGDVVPYQPYQKDVEQQNKAAFFDRHVKEEVLKVYKGPEFMLLPREMQQQLLDSTFTVNAQSNRMAILLDASCELSAKEIITSPVQPGTVQLTPSGKLIVLMRDAQTTGGYARVLQLSEKSINHLAQRCLREEVSFRL